MKRVLFSYLFVMTLVALSGMAAAAQARPPVPRPSSKASVLQTIGTTDVSITYSRPAVKGRLVYGDWTTQVAGEATLDNQNARPKDAPLVPSCFVQIRGLPVALSGVRRPSTSTLLPFLMY